MDLTKSVFLYLLFQRIMRFIQVVVLVSLHATATFGSLTEEEEKWERKYDKVKELKGWHYKNNELGRGYTEEGPSFASAHNFWKAGAGAVRDETDENVRVLRSIHGFDGTTKLRGSKVVKEDPLYASAAGAGANSLHESSLENDVPSSQEENGPVVQSRIDQKSAERKIVSDGLFSKRVARNMFDGTLYRDRTS